MPDVDEDDARQRRGAHRLGEARPAARVVLAARSSAAPTSSSRPTGAALAGLTAAMLSEGTKTRDGEALSNALQLLGTSINAGVGGRVGLDELRLHDRQVRPDARPPRRHAACNSTFPADALERLRAQRLVALTQAKAQPGAIAGRVFPRVALRDRPPVRAAADRGDAQGHHARRRRGVPQGVLPARPRASSSSSAT